MEKTKKLSKLGEWLNSDNPPLFDLSHLTQKEQERIWRMAMR